MKKIYTLVASLLLLGSTARADELGLKTTKEVGQSLKIALNAGVTASLTWSSGETETVTFDGNPQLIEVKSDSLTIKSENAITALYLPDNGLVSLNTTKLGSSLTRLICPSNELKELVVSSNTQLEELDCQDNQLTTFNTRLCTKLTTLNCSRNQLTTLEYATAPKFVSLLCAENQIDTLKNQTRMVDLESLWCQKNNIGTLTLTNSAALKSLAAFSNGLSQLRFTNVPKLSELWVEQNNLNTLDLSTGGKLARVSVHDNNLHEILWTIACSNTLTHFYAENNQLIYNSLPNVYSTTSGQYLVTTTLDPQRPYPLEERYAINEQQDFSTFLLRNGFGVSINAGPQVTNGAGETLVRNTDYTLSTHRYTFLTPQQGVTIATTSTRYPGLTLRTSAFEVYDATTNIGAATVEGVTLSTSPNSLTVKSDNATTVKIITISGVTLINRTIEAGSTTFDLPKGIYVVNEKKVAIP